MLEAEHNCPLECGTTVPVAGRTVVDHWVDHWVDHCLRKWPAQEAAQPARDCGFHGACCDGVFGCNRGAYCGCGCQGLCAAVLVGTACGCPVECATVPVVGRTVCGRHGE